jgi:hypothetical protein
MNALSWFQAFISHSSADARLVAALRTHASGLGIGIYLAEHDLHPGRHLSRKVQQEIERSHAVVVLLTHAAANSAYVQQEIGYALRCRKEVIPLVERGLPNEKLAMLQGLEHIELDPSNPDAAFERARMYLEQLKDRKDSVDTALALLLIAGLIYLWSTGEAGLPAAPA